MRVMIASGSQLAADGGAAMARRGGNAVDAAIAAMFVSLATEPGIVGPGAGGYISVWAPGEDPIVIDGYVEMPGRGLSDDQLGHGLHRVHLEYGGGVSTYVGYGSVGTPGGIAGLDMAWRLHGSADWSDLLAPAIEAANVGFPLPAAAAEYLEAARDLVYGWDPLSYESLHHDDGRPIEALETVRIPRLIESLEVLAAGGAGEMYHGSIADHIVAGMKANGGIVTAADLASYAPLQRHPIMVERSDWQIATNPAPAVGGATLAALLMLAEAGEPFTPQWNLTYMAAQRDVFGYRGRHLGPFDDRKAEATRLLEAVASGGKVPSGSPSTTHTSAVDSTGLACSITMSAGYGSGAMPAGLWMNNALGEVELMGDDPHALAPGTRLISNMAPTVARHRDGSVLAIGSPGANRITTAIASTLLRYADAAASLQAAVDGPRLHVEVAEETAVSAEPGLDTGDWARIEYPHHAMYFGGVQAASWHPDRGFEGAADPRRAGGLAIG